MGDGKLARKGGCFTPAFDRASTGFPSFRDAENPLDAAPFVTGPFEYRTLHRNPFA